MPKSTRMEPPANPRAPASVPADSACCINAPELDFHFILNNRNLKFEAGWSRDHTKMPECQNDGIFAGSIVLRCLEE